VSGVTIWLDGRDGEAVMLRREFWRLISGLWTSNDGRVEEGTDVSRAGATPDTDVAVAAEAAALMLRVLRAERLDEERWRRADVGIMDVT